LCFLEQVQDIWRVKNDNMASFCKKVKELKGTFHLFQIRHVLRVGHTSFLCLLTLFCFLLDRPALQFAMFMCCVMLYSSVILLLFIAGTTGTTIAGHAKFYVDITYNQLSKDTMWQKLPLKKGGIRITWNYL
jgi:hypothetical protein